MRGACQRFWVRLCLIALLAVVLRAIYVLVCAPVPARALDDTFWYDVVSAAIVQGHGFVIGHGALASPSFHVAPTALHPPLYPLVLAGLRELGVTSPNHLIWLGPATGTITVVGVGILGRTLVDPGIGLIAATFAAGAQSVLSARRIARAKRTPLGLWRGERRRSVSFVVARGAPRSVVRLDRSAASL